MTEYLKQFPLDREMQLDSAEFRALHSRFAVKQPLSGTGRSSSTGMGINPQLPSIPAPDGSPVPPAPPPHPNPPLTQQTEPPQNGPVKRSPSVFDTPGRVPTTPAPTPPQTTPPVLPPQIPQIPQPRAAESQGVINWSGVVEKNGLITIERDRSLTGNVQGGLPGTPVSIDLDTREFALVEVPGPANGWSRLTIRSKNGRHTVVSIRWTALL